MRIFVHWCGKELIWNTKKTSKYKMSQNKNKLNFISYYYAILNVLVHTQILHLVIKHLKKNFDIKHIKKT